MSLKILFDFENEKNGGLCLKFLKTGIRACRNLLKELVLFFLFSISSIHWQMTSH